MTEIRPERKVGEEARKTLELRLENGFIDRYLSGAHILDIGYKGYIEDVVPIVPQAVGVELDYPGYDGRTLPFPEGSQDSVFASHCLEHIPDFRNALQDWFRVLRVGGFLVIMVPHQFLYEKRVSLPSHYNADHQRFYTPASLMADIEASLAPNTYRLRHLADNDLHFDYSIPPEQHSGGCYELELVLEKIAPPSWVLDEKSKVQTRLPSSEEAPNFDAFDSHTTSLTLARDAVSQRFTVVSATPYDLAVFDFGRDVVQTPRILALKLDHLGDFIIGLPALRELREAFPQARIRLIVGSWNRTIAEASGLVDEVAICDHFPENGGDWDGKPVQDLDVFRQAAGGQFDIAVDLRLDDDTRYLLKHVDATIRCGIGTSLAMSFLNVMLPFDHALRSIAPTEKSFDVLLGPGRFHSRMPKQKPFRHDSDFSVGDTHVIFGPYIRLPLGRFRVTFGLGLSGVTIGLRPIRITIDVARNGSESVAQRTITANQLSAETGSALSLEFVNSDDSVYEFRVHARGRPIRANLTFSGVYVDRLESIPTARQRRADLHIGEQLSLLVRLLADRTRQLYPTGPAHLAEAADKGSAVIPPPNNLHFTAVALGRLLQTLPQTRYRIVIAPASNSDLRDWPIKHYIALVQMLIDRFDCLVVLIGSRAQSGPLSHITQNSGNARVVNLAGLTNWSDLPEILRSANLVICNNSGVGHLAASVGAPTLAIYSGSHQPQEWGPRGINSSALMAIVPCSPCGYDRLSQCPYDHACMQGLLPESVFEQAASRLERA